MAEISPQSLVPHAEGPVASLFLLAPRAGGRTAVLKVYPRPLDRRTYNGIEVEQAKLAGLRTAGSIVLVDALEELSDGRTGLRSQFCPQSLLDLVARGPLPIKDVAILGQILSSVLSEAHDLGLVHGGVTPSNVRERPNGQPALSDFGITLRLRFPRDLTPVAGCTAPEVLRDGELSEQADVYGLGAVLYVALTGHAPFTQRAGESSEDVVLRVLRDPVSDVTGRDVPGGLSGLLRRMMAKDPAQRPDAVEVLQVFQELLAALDSHRGDQDLDFDDFSDELPSARITSAGTGPALPMPAARVRVAAQPRRRRLLSKGLPKGALIGAGAAASVLAVLVVMILPSGESAPGAAPQVPTVPVMPPSQTPSPDAPSASTASPFPPSVRLVLQPPQDNGTSVLLRWTSSKPLTYALNVAQQGGAEAQTTYRGSGTSFTVPVVPGLKYCFEIQGTDGNAIYISESQPLRGADCRRRR